MLNPFPILLDYQLLSPFLIRIVAGVIFIDLGYFMLTKERERWLALFSDFLKAGKILLNVVAAIEIVGGLMFVVGFLTQYAALALAILSFLNLYLEWIDPVFVRRNFVFHLMLFVMTISLLFSGAGFLAFDLPL
jgi:uncharacterized membrane protein YphA (DoxX/SURF4 family)